MSATVVGRILLGIGALGVVLALCGIAVGLRLLTGFDAALDDSLAVTADALDAVDASVQVSEGAVTSLTGALRRTESTTRELADGFVDAREVLDATAVLTEEQLAGSLQAVERALPALIDTAAVIDRTLSALSSVPFGPAYDPVEPFDDSLRSLQQELDGLPEALQEQADLIREASSSLGTVQEGTVSIADDIGDLETSLSEAGALLADYASTATSARQLVDSRQGDLQGELRLARVLVVALGITIIAANTAPIAVGWLVLRTGGRPLEGVTPPA